MTPSCGTPTAPRSSRRSPRAAGGRRLAVRPGADPGRRHRRGRFAEAQRGGDHGRVPRTRAGCSSSCAAEWSADDRLDAEVQVGGRLGAERGSHDADVRPAGAARRVRGASAARLGRTGRHLVARGDAGQARLRRARRAGRPAGHRRRHRRRPAGRAAPRAKDYAPGDTDLAWTRTTPWRALLASAFDDMVERDRRPAEVQRRARATRAPRCSPAG